ncbi:hypothetical protein H072_4025 [Dactylellina haptotyla CBS 200.50]|uniref:ARID domain-containing protein n=1 Tax=Dactylellina haptotyla (strain CBS 200.50) TaxID=1284197 RepID=S8BRC3_DACHA|nr:hypothetical protein H072_4025 [Dactylellina haptotyla CBS 200.50]
MGPKNQYTAHPREFDESDIDRNEEYEQFIEKLRVFHEKRNSLIHTNFEPDIQRKKVDLLKLYKLIVAQGGYTIVSQKTGLWKELAVNFNPPQHNTNIGFVLKTIYWKNLAAWECVDHWGEEAPVPEALETQSAAGSDLVGRKPPESTEISSPALLTRGRTGTGEPPAAGSTTTTPSGRTLREAPPKRQFFQPEVSTPKPRNPSAPNQSPAPQPTMNGKSSNSFGSGASAMDQHPLPPVTITPLPTPYSHPHKFARKYQPKAPVNAFRLDVPLGYHGVTDMSRAVMGIRSGIPQEVFDGLQTLLQRSSHTVHNISLRDYPTLSFDLLAIVDDCATAVSDEKIQGELGLWHPNSYNPGSQISTTSFNTLAATLEPQEWRKKMDLGLHAIDILRNIIVRDSKNPVNDLNTRYLVATHPNLVPLLFRGLETPKSHHFVEFKRCCLELLGSVARITDFEEEAELVTKIWDNIQSDDATTVVLKLGVMVNLSLREKTEHLKNVPDFAWTYLENLLMSNDDRLLIACLDFMYHCTFLDENIALLTQRPDAVQKLSQLTRLLSHGNIRIPPEISATTPVNSANNKKIVPQVTPDLPPDLLTEILKLAEPQRAVWWMRSSFESNPESEITQIALWQAYQRQFAGYANVPPRPQALLQANDFIKNVSVAFTGARPQMIPGEPGQPSRFVINGIAPREEPMGLDYEVYVKCDWQIPKESAATGADTAAAMRPCGQFFPNAASLYNHIRDKHTFLSKKAENTATEQICRWRDCNRFPAPGTTNKKLFHGHLLCHMPVKTGEAGVKNRKGSIIATENAKPVPAPISKKADPAKKHATPGITWTTEIAARSKGDDTAGIPMMAARVLNNLSTTDDPEGISNLRLLRPVMFNKMAMTRNRFLVEALVDILNNLAPNSKEDVTMAEAMIVDTPSSSDY